jgi:hypothetical protein
MSRERLGPAAHHRRALAIAGLAVLAVAIAAWLPPIAQDPAYHAFADQRRLLGVPSFLNVASNLFFVLVGAHGLRVVRRAGAPRRDGPFGERWEQVALLVMFAGVALTGLGSAWYHLAPGNGTLVWDRLPMTLAFMTLLALTIGERVSSPIGPWLLPVLLAVGAASVAVWHVSEASGRGDLRLYGLVQFFPLVAIPLMLALFPPRYTRGADLVLALGLYVVAKLFELLDAAIFSLGHLVSGHTLKHLVAAGATGVIARMIARRRPLPGHAIGHRDLK